jgi:sulfite exporter TauE/SafE/copper chaperone CopZ
MKTTTLNVKGMHCNACKLLLETSLSKLPRIKKVEAKVSKGTVSLSYEGTLPLEDITTVIRECGYEVSEEAVNRPRLSKNLKDYKILLISLISFILLYLILRQTGISSLFDIQSQKSPSLGLVLLIGITAGFSSCMAVVGGLVLAISTKRNTHNTQQSFGQKIIPHLRFNVGRIVGFGVLGGVLGLFGSVLNLSPFVMAVITLIVGVVMLVLGINLTHISPKISSFSFSLPKTPLTSLDPLVEKSHSSLKNSWKTFGAGMLTFFLPCGFTFAMQLYAISTGSFRMGMAVMSLFAVGTLPGLLGV